MKPLMRAGKATRIFGHVMSMTLAAYTATAAHAATVVSTLPRTSRNSVGIGGINDYAAGFVWASANAFSTADLFLSVAGEPAAPLSVSLYDDAGGIPGSEVLVLSGPSDILLPGLYSYSGSITLTQGDTYWIVATTGIYSDTVNQYLWWDGTLGDPNYVNTLWQRPPDSVTWVPSSLVSPAAFRVNAVPEPYALALIVCGLVWLNLTSRLGGADRNASCPVRGLLTAPTPDHSSM